MWLAAVIDQTIARLRRLLANITTITTANNNDGAYSLNDAAAEVIEVIILQ